jgi:hypothetical protein
LLQLALLALLALAAADPFFFWEVRNARRIVLVIDNSASMNATDIKPSRLDEARRQAERVIAGLRYRDELALISAGTQPLVVCGFTGRRKTLRTALERLPATDGPSQVADAAAVGRRLLGERQDGKQPEVIVLTDGCFEGADNLLRPSAASLLTASETAAPAAPAQSPAGPEPPPVNLQVIGTRSGNVGITQFQVRRSVVDPLGYEILAAVTNASDEPAEFRFEIELDGEPIDVVPLKLEAGGKWSQVFEKTSAEGGRLVAHLTHEDALAADNSAWAVLPRREVQPVLLVTEGNLFLQKVFESNPLVRLTIVKEPPAAIPAGTVVVYHRVVPKTIPPGSVFVIDPAESSDLWTTGDVLQNPIVTQQDKDSPVMAHVRLDNVLMPKARKLTPLEAEQAHVLAASVATDPLFLSIERPNGKVLVLTVNLDEGDLPLRTAFPISVANALHWFAGNKNDLRESLSTGSLASATSADFAASLNGRSLTLRSPGGRLKPLPANFEKLTLGPLDECGVWSLVPVVPTSEQPAAAPSADERSEGNGRAAAPRSAALMDFACNLASPAESDIRPPAELLDRPAPATMRAGLGAHPAWFWLLLAGLILTSVEWCLYQRRVIS